MTPIAGVGVDILPAIRTLPAGPLLVLPDRFIQGWGELALCIMRSAMVSTSFFHNSLL